jgi:hypothetical protein
VKQNVTKLILSVARGGARIKSPLASLFFKHFHQRKKLLTPSKFLFLFFVEKNKPSLFLCHFTRLLFPFLPSPP